MSYASTYGAGAPDQGYAPPAGFNPAYPGPYGAPGSQSYGAPSSATPYAPPPSYGPPSSYGAPGYGLAGQGFGAPAPQFEGSDEPRTLFITGFPADVKERELNNLCRFLPGYQASQMHWKNGLAQGFAIFTTPAHARAACDALRQLCFDEAAVLRAELARKNMFLKDDTGMMSAKRPRTEGRVEGGGGAQGDRSISTGGPRVYVEQADNAPGNTLYIGNLAHGVSEAELTEAFSKGRGFRQMKLTQGAKFMACFVEYDDIPSATEMHQANQGLTLRSSDRGPIRVMFSKAPFGRKREGAGEGPQTGAFAATATANAAALAASYAPPEYKPEYGSMA